MKIKFRILFAFFIIVVSFPSSAQDLSYKIRSLKSKLNNTSSQTLKAQYLIKLGNIYQQADSIDQAIEAYNQALAYINNTRNYPLLFQLNSFLGVLYSEKQDYAKAKKHFTNSVRYAKKLGGKNRLSQALLNLGNVQRELKQYKEAISTYEEALSLAFDLNNLQLVKQAYTYMAMCYKALGDNDRYFKYFNLSVAIDKKIKQQIIQQKELEARRQAELARQKDLMLQLQQYKMKNVEDSLRQIRILNERNKMKIALLEKEAQLKELQMKQREAELQRKEAEQRMMKTIILALLVILVIIIIAGIAVYKLYRDKKKANKQLAKLNAELKEINTELEEKNRVIAKQKEELEEKNRQIKDSIEYASRIQQAILPSQASIMGAFPAGAFIFYLPRDIVSGDFYWFSRPKDSNYHFLAVVDCTGHSVPGAFMSLIGNTLLNELVNSKHKVDPAEILKELHENLVSLLHKDKKEEINMQDGMDIALLRFDFNKKELVFASANQPLFLVYPDGRVEETDGDIFSIGGYFGSFGVEFQNKIFSLEEGTNIYLTTDGYFDQFDVNGENKFSRKRFVKMLKNIYSLPFNLQYQRVVDTFYDWRGDFRQVDDVLVIGIRFSTEPNKIDEI